jgi:hypothetical protein
MYKAYQKSITRKIRSLYGIVARTAPRITAQNAPDSQIQTFERAMFDNGLTGIFAARRSEPTGRGSIG